MLTEGEKNALTAKELTTIMGCDIRDITAAVERERRQGQPICAASGKNPGYYLAANANELQNYCNRLHHRAAELYKTRQALLKILKQLPGTETGGTENAKKDSKR